jgi:hypothetical protein
MHQHDGAIDLAVPHAPTQVRRRAHVGPLASVGDLRSHGWRYRPPAVARLDQCRTVSLSGRITTRPIPGPSERLPRIVARDGTPVLCQQAVPETHSGTGELRNGLGSRPAERIRDARTEQIRPSSDLVTGDDG